MIKQTEKLFTAQRSLDENNNIADVLILCKELVSYIDDLIDNDFKLSDFHIKLTCVKNE